MDYLYDGTFEGLLTCVYQNYYGTRAEGIYPAEDYQVSILQPFERLKTDETKAMAVYKGIRSKISEEALERIYKVHLSTFPDKEIIILRYIRLGFKQGSSISSLHAHPVVLAMQEQEHKVGLEVHRLMGLLRFSEIGGILFCRVEPDHDILELMADHFSDRYKNERFIIYDKRRGKAVFSEGGLWYISTFDPEIIPGFDQEEKLYQKLWKTYFDNIAIKERTNPRCQRNFMPARYWKNLTEISKGEEIDG
jgi:probable DNA metabolism protein